jgi:hypothetical protein
MRFARSSVPCWAYFFFSQKEKVTKINPDQIRRQRESFGRGREKNSICEAAFWPWIIVVRRKLSNRFFAGPATKIRLVGIFSKAGWAVRNPYSSLFDF